MNTKLASLALLAASLLASCASSSATATSAAIPPSKGRVLFYRESGIFGYAQRAQILLDGQKVGRSAPGAKFQVDVEPGTHRVTIPNIMYPGKNEQDVTVRATETVYVKTSIGGSAYAGRTNIDIVPSGQGALESAKLKGN